MFDEDNKPVRVTMIMHHNDGRSVSITNDYGEFVAWPQMAYQFYCFLAAQGYILDKEDVGSTDDDL